MKQLEGKLPMTTLSTEPAFPVNGATSWYPGMTLRDYFAAQAMQGLVAYADMHDMAALATLPKIAYYVADAMVNARDERL
jgi:hypothetical protein